MSVISSPTETGSHIQSLWHENISHAYKTDIWTLIELPRLWLLPKLASLAGGEGIIGTVVQVWVPFLPI